MHRTIVDTLGDEGQRICEFGPFASQSDQFKAFNQCRNSNSCASHQDSRTVAPITQVVLKVRGHGLSIFRDEQPIFALCPEKNLCIGGAESQLHWVTHPNDVEHEITAQIAPQYCLPQRASQVLVEHEREWHEN